MKTKTKAQYLISSDDFIAGFFEDKDAVAAFKAYVLDPAQLGMEEEEVKIIQWLDEDQTEAVFRTRGAERYIGCLVKIRGTYTIDDDALNTWVKKQVIGIIGADDWDPMVDPIDIVKEVFCYYKSQPICDIDADGTVWVGRENTQGGHDGVYLDAQEVAKILIDAKNDDINFDWV